MPTSHEHTKICAQLTPHTGLSARREEIVLFGFAIALVLGTANLTVLQAQQPEPKESSQQNAKVLIDEKSVPASDTLTTSVALSRNESGKDTCDFSFYRPVRISQFDSRAILKKVHPEYPREAATRDIQGRVTIKALVNDKGNVERACAIQGEQMFHGPAEAAALQWKLKPKYGLAFSRPITPKNPKNFAELYIVFDFKLDKPGREEPDQKTAGLITSLQRGSFEEVTHAIHALHASGKKAIPSLIESISKDHYVANLFKDPTSSYIQNGSLSQFAGVRSAYVIELILASDKLPSTNVKKTSFVLGPQPQNYLYSQAVIVKGAKQPISRQDLLTVKDIYRQWWEGNKGKSIDALRNSWQVGDRPLEGQDFSWDGTGPDRAPRSSREKLADSQDIAELVQKAVSLPFPSRAEEMRQQLTHLGGSATPFIAESVRNNARMNPIKKAFLVGVIAGIPSDESLALRTLLTDKDPHVRGLSVEYLGKRRASVAIPDLVALLDDRAIYFTTFRTDPTQEERTLVRDVAIASLESVTGLTMSPHASKEQQAQEWIRWWQSQQKAQSVTR